MKYLVLLLSLALVACSSTADNDNVMNDNMDEGIQDDMIDNDNMDEEMQEEIMDEPDVTFVVTGENFAFFMDGKEAPELVVNQGDLVRIEFTSTDGFHDWVVDEFDAATEKVQTGASTYVEFVADKTGTFEYYCSVGSHRANGMVGNLVVQ